MGEGLKRLQESRAVMHVYLGMLNGHFKENPFHHQHLKVFGKVSLSSYYDEFNNHYKHFCPNSGENKI